MLCSLNQRATLEAMTLVPDGGGGYSESWQSFASVWVGVTPLSAADTALADMLQSKVRHRVALRRRSDIAAGQRVVTASRRFKIHAVLDKGPADPLLQLLCEELP